MWARDCVGIIGLDYRSTLVVVSECARHNKKPTCCPWCVGVPQLCARRRAGRGGTRTNISTTRISLSPTTCRADTTQWKVCFLVFAYSWLRRRAMHTIANVCTHIRARVLACNLNTTPNVLAELHTFIQSLVDMPSKRPGTCPPPRLSYEACAGQFAMGL